MSFCLFQPFSFCLGINNESNVFFDAFSLNYIKSFLETFWYESDIIGPSLSFVMK